MRRILAPFILAMQFVIAGLLAGCASTLLVDSDVRTFSSLPAVAPGATYRFERLPSQQTYGEQHAKVERVAEMALAKVGLVRSDSAARYSVQLGVRTQRDPRAPWDDMWPGWGLAGRDYIVTGTGQLMWMNPFPRIESPYYRREISIVMRDLATNQVVYETHAAHDGRWADSASVLPAMFEAALQGFPQPPQGTRRVNVEVQTGKK